MIRRISTLIVALVALSACAAFAERGPELTVVRGEATVQNGSLDRLVTGSVVTASGVGAVTELEWKDGAIARLSDGATFEVGGTPVRGTLTEGKLWVRVSLPGDDAAGAFALGTPGGTITASVATFVVTCTAGACEVSVLSGAVADGASLLTGPATAVLADGAFRDAEPLPWDRAFGDDFVVENGELDETAGAQPASYLYAGTEASLASIAGELVGTATIEQVECSGPGSDCDEILADGPGDVFDISFLFDIDCSDGIPCYGTALVPVATVGEGTEDETVFVTFDGTTYSWVPLESEPLAICEFNDGTTDGTYLNTLLWTLTPTEAKVVNGEYVVTAATGTGRFELLVDEPLTSGDPDCESFVNEWLVVQSYSLEREIPPGAVVVDQAPEAAEPEPAPDTASRLGTGDPDAPSVLQALDTVAQAPVEPEQIAGALAGTLILVVLTAFPTSLLNTAIEGAPERWRSLSKRWSRRARRTPAQNKAADDAVNHRVGSKAWWFAAAGVVAGALISGFVDPQFGFNPGSARVAISIAIAFLVDVVIGWSVAIWIARRVNREATARFEFKPWTLLVVAGAVTLTRLVHFEPGIVFGLVAGVVIGVAVGKAATATKGADKALAARAALAQSGYAFALGVLGWLGYSVAASYLPPEPGFGGVLLLETLAGLTVAGIASTPISLLPFRGLGGHTLFTWKRGVWAAAYGVAMLGFFFIVMPMPTSWGGVGLPVATWFILYACYAVAAVVLWLAVAQPWKKEDAATS